MGSILKHSFKSMFAHKLRMFMMTLCIFICGFSAMLSFDMSGTLETVIKSVYSQVLGNSDMTINSENAFDDMNLDDAPENNAVWIQGIGNKFTQKISYDYGYFEEISCSILGIDEEKAEKTGLVSKGFSLADNELAISKNTAEKLGYKKGDKVNLYDKHDNPVEFIVKDVYQQQGIFNLAGAVVNVEGIKKLNDGKFEPNTACIDVIDDSKQGEMKKYIESKYPTAEIENIMEDEDLQDNIDSIKKLFLTLFAICLLLVIFVTISISERIISEKTSVIGTFKSLGLPSSLTTFSLFFDNIFYAVVGSLLSILAYSSVRDSFLNGMFQFGTAEGSITPNFGEVNPLVYIAVFLTAIIIECLCPIKEIVKMLKTSIRDIIFSNKDTEYKQNKISVIIGIIMAVIAIVTQFVGKTYEIKILCFVSTIAAVALLFPVLLVWVSKGISKFADKFNMPTLQLAAIEVASKKSTVGSATLCITAACITAVIYIFVNSLSLIYNHNDYADNTVIVDTNMATKNEMFSYIEDMDDVEKVENIYIEFYSTSKINNKETNLNIVGWKDGGYENFNGIVPENNKIAEDEIIMDKFIAEKNNLEIGDEAEIVFNSDGFMPFTKKLKLAGYIKENYFDGTGFTCLISEKLYKDMFNDYPYELVVKTSNPEETKEFINAHSANLIMDVSTKEESMEKIQTESASMNMVLNLIIVIGIAVTLIGVASNQIVGFEGRKRECAVLVSTSMTKGRLAKMFFIESMLASGIAFIVSVPITALLIQPFNKIMELLTVVINIKFDIAVYAGFILFLWILFTIISFFPIRAMRKSDIVSQLKYE